MAKFSIRDEEEDDEEFCTCSPKRRRTFIAPSNSDESRQQQSPPPANDDEGSTVGPTDSGEPVWVMLSDPDVLDCSICFHPLTIPVFPCDNGHVSCCSCCISLGNKCPSCCEKIGNNRCRAIEKVIESVKVSCCYLRKVQ